MICPNCGAEVAGTVNFCENCGSPITPSAPATQPLGENASAQQAAGQTATMPSAPEQQPFQQATAQPFQQPPQQPGAYGMPGASAPQASNAPFVLAIIALVTAILGLFPVSIVLAIIALVMNAGQKKRGESSTKQTPTTVMSVISLVLSAITLVITIMIGGLLVTAAVNGDLDFDDLGSTPTASVSSSSSSSATASSSASPSASSSSSAASSSSSSAASAGTPITGTSDLVGTWKLTKLVEDGEETATDEIELMQNMGLEISLALNEDGSCALTLFGVKTQGIWEAPSPNTVYLMIDGDSITCPVDTNTGELYLEDDEDQITFTKQ